MLLGEKPVFANGSKEIEFLLQSINLVLVKTLW